MKSQRFSSLLRAISLPGVVLLIACAAPAPALTQPGLQTPGPTPQHAPAPQATTSATSASDGRRDEGPLAAELVDALGVAAAPWGSASVPTAAPTTSAPAPAAQGYVREDPFLPGPVFSEEQTERLSPELMSQQAELAARWNLGGASREDHPSRSPRFHPGTRVVVEATLAGVFRPTAKRADVRKQAQARVRARGYWPLRACYETSWRKGHDESTDHTIRATLLGSGRVQATRTLQSEGPTELGPCLRKALARLELGPLPARRIDADLRIRFWPGDAPPPRDAELGPDACADADATGPLERAAQVWRASTEALNACVEPALARDGELWGRLALRARFDRNGWASEVTQFQTVFPDAAVVGCVTRIVEQTQLGPTDCPADLVFALRVGEPPGDIT